LKILKRIFRAAFAIFVFLLLLGAVLYSFPEKFLCVDSGPKTADVLIVLGGGLHERPLRAAELFKEHAAPRIIITGAGDNEINRQLLIRNGVPATAIQVEGKSTTTHENAEFTIKLLRVEKVHSAILVTSWYHSRRALATFQHAAPEMKFYSRPAYLGFAASHVEWLRLGIAKRIRLEYLKLPGYWVRYGVWPF
jgi:uncharacterized SAM-binding protein YcdF (DUF218 family)